MRDLCRFVKLFICENNLNRILALRLYLLKSSKMLTRILVKFAIFLPVIFVSSCQPTYKIGNCTFVKNPTEGKMETADAKVDDLPPFLSGLVPKFIWPRKTGRIFVTFSKQPEEYSLNVNTYFSALIDDLDKITPENKLILTVNDTLKMELSPREERLGSAAPEAVYLLSAQNLDELITAKKLTFGFTYTSLAKKSMSKNVKVNPSYLKTIQQRAVCIKEK